MGKKIVVIGGVACGPKAAARLKRLDASCEITIIERDSDVSYGACGLPFYLEGEIPELDDLTKTPVGVPRNVGFFKAAKGVDIRTQTEVTAIDRAKQTVKIKNLTDNSEEDLPYDNLIIATGSSPLRPPIPGIDAGNIYCLKTMDDGGAIKKAMETSSTKKAVIIGGGLIGLECIEPLLKYGFEVHLVEKLPFVLPALLDEEMATPLMKHLAAQGVNLHCGDGVVKFEGDANNMVSKVVTEQTEIEADLVILSIGFRPNINLAKDAGLELGQFGIKVDAHLRTSDPKIYAGGDCIESFFAVTGKPMYAPMGSTANKHGRIIANNIAGWNSTFGGVCGTGVCRILGFNVGRTGLTERDALAAGMEVTTALNPGMDRPHYMKEAKLIHVKLIAESRTGRVLGMQVMGPGEVLSRVDTIATLLANRGTVDDLFEIDMAYAPPFSPAMDHLIVAANIIQNKLDGLASSYSPAEVKAKLDNKEDFVLLDARMPSEVEMMNLPYDNMVHIPLGKLREKAGELPTDKEIVCLCKISLRGYEAVRILVEQGLNPDNLSFLDGGVVAWPYEKIVN
jgi:NADPH-dependent 2,4-dienoyl-CoA reductase/sulfur reductase-like enzyme/rhodanese-related sulfurtransferase